MNGRSHHTNDWCLPYHTDTLTHRPLWRHPSDPQSHSSVFTLSFLPYTKHKVFVNKIFFPCLTRYLGHKKTIKTLKALKPISKLPSQLQHEGTSNTSQQGMGSPFAERFDNTEPCVLFIVVYMNMCCGLYSNS